MQRSEQLPCVVDEVAPRKLKSPEVIRSKCDYAYWALTDVRWRVIESVDSAICSERCRDGSRSESQYLNSWQAVTQL